MYSRTRVRVYRSSVALSNRVSDLAASTMPPAHQVPLRVARGANLVRVPHPNGDIQFRSRYVAYGVVVRRKQTSSGRKSGW
jgi:hypothetical protein